MLMPSVPKKGLRHCWHSPIVCCGEGELFLFGLLAALLFGLLAALLAFGTFAIHGAGLAVLLALFFALFFALFLALFLVATLTVALLLRSLSVHGEAENGGSCNKHQFLHNHKIF